MACYLCAQLRHETPETPDSSDPASGVPVNEPLGTCAGCSVWACSQHATKYALYICAMCQPALAVAGALAGGPSNSAAEELARRRGRRTSRATRAHVRAAITLITSPRTRFALSEGGPDLVVDFASAVRQLGERREVVPSLANNDMLDVVAADIRAQFAGRDLRPDAQSPETIAGALVQAMALADPARKGDHVRAPWQVQHPQLLAPALWLAAGAFALTRPEEVERG